MRFLDYARNDNVGDARDDIVVERSLDLARDDIVVERSLDLARDDSRGLGMT